MPVLCVPAVEYVHHSSRQHCRKHAAMPPRCTWFVLCVYCTALYRCHRKGSSQALRGGVLWNAVPLHAGDTGGGASGCSGLACFHPVGPSSHRPALLFQRRMAIPYTPAPSGFRWHRVQSPSSSASQPTGRAGMSASARGGSQ